MSFWRVVPGRKQRLRGWPMDRKAIEQYRLALFGRMGMGVSHGGENHLSVVLGFAELLQASGGGGRSALAGAGKMLSRGG